MDSIFATESSSGSNPNMGTDPTRMPTYTKVVDSLPLNKRQTRIMGWETKYKTEWRWRFIQFNDGKRERFVVETSYQSCDGQRMYLNKFGSWVESTVDSIYDNYVTEVYYYYSMS